MGCGAGTGWLYIDTEIFQSKHIVLMKLLQPLYFLVKLELACGSHVG